MGRWERAWYVAGWAFDLVVAVAVGASLMMLLGL